jgi:hypothetical protein
MSLNDKSTIRATEIQAILRCSKSYSYRLLNSLPRITLAFTADRPPRACLRADFDKWLSDKNIVVGGTND